MKRYLQLNNFRNHCHTEIPLHNNVFVIYGNNGEGKTNLLEAISMFSGSKGLRHCKAEDITTNGENSWSVIFSLDDGIFTTGYVNGRKIYKISDKNVKNLSEFAKNHYILWMTYETDRLFAESPANRRNFIDMFACGKFPTHSEDLKNYEKLTRERLKILKNCGGIVDSTINKWLNIIEERIANTGIKIANTRINIVDDIYLGQNTKIDFPTFSNKMIGKLEDLMENAGNLLDAYKTELVKRRQKDFFTNSTTLGPNRSDWEVFHLGKQIKASQCSAGEQKILLLGIFLSFIRQNTKSDKRELILLLDDVIAHLDTQHRALLFHYIKDLHKSFVDNQMRIMIWLSGTNKKLFEEFANLADFFEVSHGNV